MSEPAFDELLRRLSEAGVEFVLIGGLAVNAWGVVRGTKDVDVVVATDSENLERIAEVAVAIGGHVQRGEALLGSPFSIAAELASGEQMMIETDLGKLDVVQGLDGVLPYAELRPRASEAEVLGVKVAVCSREDLLAMKRAAGRPRDLVDLEDLDAAGRLRHCGVSRRFQSLPRSGRRPGSTRTALDFGGAKRRPCSLRPRSIRPPARMPGRGR